MVGVGAPVRSSLVSKSRQFGSLGLARWGIKLYMLVSLCVVDWVQLIEMVLEGVIRGTGPLFAFAGFQFRSILNER